ASGTVGDGGPVSGPPRVASARNKYGEDPEGSGSDGRSGDGAAGAGPSNCRGGEDCGWPRGPGGASWPVPWLSPEDWSANGAGSGGDEVVGAGSGLSFWE